MESLRSKSSPKGSSPALDSCKPDEILGTMLALGQDSKDILKQVQSESPNGGENVNHQPYKSFGKELPNLSILINSIGNTSLHKYNSDSPLFGKPPEDASAAEILALMYQSPHSNAITNNNTPKRSRENSHTSSENMLLPKRRKHGSNGRRSYRESCEQFFNFIKNSFRDGNTSFKLSDIHDQLSCEKHHIDLIIKVLISLSLIDNSKGEEQMFWFETSSLVKKLSLFKPTTSTSVDTFLGEVNFNSVECILHQLVSLLLEDVDTPISFSGIYTSLFGRDGGSYEQVEELNITVQILLEIGLLFCDGDDITWRQASHITNVDILLPEKSIKILKEKEPLAEPKRRKTNTMKFTEIVMDETDGNNSSSGSHRASCHRCGNMRKQTIKCTNCPQIYCRVCSELMLEQHGLTVFKGGCPKCKEVCCCGKNKSQTCKLAHHCYRKCPSSKANQKNVSYNTNVLTINTGVAEELLTTSNA